MKIKQITLLGLMMAAICIGTMSIMIPMPATGGYVNIGDSVIFMTSILFGPAAGLIAGGIGSALADLLSGYAHWAPFTLVIKGLEGLVVGLLMKKGLSKGRMLTSTLVGACLMVTGYLFAGAFMEGSMLVALESVPGNIFQGVASMAIAVPVSIAISKTSYVRDNMLSRN
ncbi:Uncharacterized membrane protein [Peptoclostridium litorale DSM 5388]|uniref:ECF-type riboflavin transporter, S component family protein n=1 Tax=Peptoclostridium litorale DSM 5388 TaxID=1121324 RepID=A0A069RDD0_PEPLI|nr:ECF transporter S component [Peptoclostridium litorale]KDR95046.1 ECF-type riboflavin transporter, S component family protein [Peptoclostridium litorale DSM 5388]SIN75921.1 Uncharacterized membrane protein [Peptoclostridium litorale DSM 5388]